MSFLLFVDYEKVKQKYDAFKIDNEEEIASYYAIRTELDALGEQFRGFITKPKHLVQFLQAGRLVKVSYSQNFAFYTPILIPIWEIYPKAIRYSGKHLSITLEII